MAMSMAQGEKTFYMDLSYVHLDPVVDEVAQGQEHLLMDMYRQELGRRFEQVTTFAEEKKILRKYFRDRFHPITDEVYRIITYPDDYKFEFENNRDALVEQYLKSTSKKISSQYTGNKSYGYQSFASRYGYSNQPKYPTLRIRKEHLNLHKQKFKEYILNEVKKDRGRQVIYITFSIDMKKYPEKQLFATIDDTKELLHPDDILDLDDKIRKLLDMMKGKVSIYCVEAFVSFYLSEVAHVQKKRRPNMIDKLAKYNEIIEYPGDEEIASPETFIGNLYDIINKMPRGTKINNVETILRPDLIWRFRKYKAMLKDKYPTKPALSKIEVGFHGTREDRMGGIVERGLMIPNSDNGLNAFTCGARYGKGIYLSPNARFSMHYCRGDSCLLVCAVLPGRKYTCTDNMWSNSRQKTYDSHISVDNTELVLFDEGQVLPCVIIHFTLTDNYLDWYNYIYNGTKEKKPKESSYREQMKNMNKKEKQEYLASFAASHLSYGYGPLKEGRKCEYIDVSFPDEQDEEWQDNAVWYGERDSEHHNKYQNERFAFTDDYIAYVKGD